ncbi:hypothetical protein ACHAWF_017852 [Thalassiosira exigua]
MPGGRDGGGGGGRSRPRGGGPPSNPLRRQLQSRLGVHPAAPAGSSPRRPRVRTDRARGPSRGSSRRLASSSSAPRSGPRASRWALALSIPVVAILCAWQHALLMDRLEGGGEYAAFWDDEVTAGGDDGGDARGGGGGVRGSYWEEGVRGAAEVVSFVMYGSGLMTEEEEDEDDDAVDLDDEVEVAMDEGDDEISVEAEEEEEEEEEDNYDEKGANEGDGDEEEEEEEDKEEVEDSKAAAKPETDAKEKAPAKPQEKKAKPGPGSIVPYDLSVNHLRRIVGAPGRPPPEAAPSGASPALVPEDFLPVVDPSYVKLRWRHRPASGSNVPDAARVSAYRIVARRAGGSLGTEDDWTSRPVLWDSRTVLLDDDEALPHEVAWPRDRPLRSGEVVEWRVRVRDVRGRERASARSKFAVGPDKVEGWEGGWIVHPDDWATFDAKRVEATDECERWKERRPLPRFRATLSRKAVEEALGGEALASALLVASGLGSFRASFDGVPLSSSGPIDPPFTDYSRRVAYRGFDVTDFLARSSVVVPPPPPPEGGKAIEDGAAHVIGMSTGRGWWDLRPLSGMAKPELLPRGPIAVVAQLYLTTAGGEVRVVLPTRGGGEGDDDGGSWRVSRGPIVGSDLFAGETVDVGVLTSTAGWDAPAGGRSGKWIAPAPYRARVTWEEFRQDLALKAKALDPKEARSFPPRDHLAAPIGELIPPEVPPVLPLERIAPEEARDLGSGRWLLDFGKAMSGVLHFERGLPAPIVPAEGKYPRGHGFKKATKRGDAFVTVIYGESLEMTTGDINRVLVAGLGMHDGGPRHVSNAAGAQDGKPCFPEDHDGVLSQRDVYLLPSSRRGKADETTADERRGRDAAMFSAVRQSHFTTHGFRFAEVCCLASPPEGVRALLYRTAIPEWGSFSSSNVRINGGYELVKNALASNMLSVQSDCPHREKLPYGGDLVADSPAAMHIYDMSSFYKKTIRDWLDAQWDNGAYTETSVWQDLNDYAGIGHGAGETVWATAPPVLTVRHMQHYGDIDLLRETMPGHARWLQFLNGHFAEGMEAKGYDRDLKKYKGDGSGLGDWLSLRQTDTFLTHTAFYMAAARCVAYIAEKLGDGKLSKKSRAVAERVRDRIASLYMKNGRDDFDYPRGGSSGTPGPEMGLFARIVPGEKRCAVLRNWFKRSGSIWPGDEEQLFLAHLDESHKKQMVRTGELVKDSDEYWMGWSQWQGFNEGIFAIRYALKTLSDNGFHHVALRKAVGFGFGTPEYWLSHNATTMWETWWRSEDVYSRNHPMLGAIAEWMASSVAGVSLHPATVGGRHALFWPRFPRSAAVLEHAGAVQGSPVGDYAVAWRFEDLPEEKDRYDSAFVKVRIRVLIPPTAEGTVRLAVPVSKETKITIGRSQKFPDLALARKESNVKCIKRRKRRLGFPYSWEYSRVREKWYKQMKSKSIGTPCESFLFSVLPLTDQWGGRTDMTNHVLQRKDLQLPTGLYDIVYENWQLEREVEGTGRLGNIPEYFDPSSDAGPYCKEKSTFEWNIDDATHII